MLALVAAGIAKIPPDKQLGKSELSLNSLAFVIDKPAATRPESKNPNKWHK